MANGDFNDIFSQYYTLYRAESDVPASDDDEYSIALVLSKEAINRWANYDATYWKELFVRSIDAVDGDNVIVASTTDYAAPTDMREAGGFIKLRDATTNAVQANYPIIDPQEAQFKNDNSRYAYFTGNPTTGFTLHLSITPSAEDAGKLIDYVYYKKPTYFTVGTSTTEMADTSFIVHRMLAQRFRASRNPYYTSALRDAEDSLRMMQADNNSGSWANPWTLQDNSGTQWGL